MGRGAPVEASNQKRVTELLVAWKDGSEQALDDLIPFVYKELHRLAKNQL